MATHAFLWLLFASTSAEWSSCDRDYMTCKAEHTSYLAL